MNKKMQCSFLLFFFVVIFLGISPRMTVLADENQDMGGFTIEGIPHEKQIDSSKGYFYLHEQPKEKDQIKLKLINTSNEAKTLEVIVTNANTNVNGLLDYTGSLKNHDSLTIPLTSLLIADSKEVLVPEKSEVETTLSLTMPEEKLEGIIMGGIVVSEKEESNNSKQAMNLQNTYSYTLGVVLTNEKTTPIYKNVSVKLENVGAKLFDGKKIVQANILNQHPYIFGEATVEGEIYEENQQEVIQKMKKEKVKIAPYSVYPFQFDWKKAELKPGNYVFCGKVKTEENEWTFKKKFTITNEEAVTINKESVFKVRIPKWMICGGFLFGLISVIISILILVRFRRTDYEEK